MLQSRNLSGVLSQVIQRENPSETESNNSIVSAILITVSGQPVASYHANRTPPPPRTTHISSLAVEDKLSSQAADPISSRGRNSNGVAASSNSSTTTTTTNTANTTTDPTSTPYQVSRSMKTKLYALFASSAWQEYQRAGMGHVTAASDVKRGASSAVVTAEEVEQQQIQVVVVGQEAAQSYYNQHDWICFKTEDATQILITPVNLQTTSSQLLLILVADGECPLGHILKKSQETVKVLEEGLDKYRVYD